MEICKIKIALALCKWEKLLASYKVLAGYTKASDNAQGHTDGCIETLEDCKKDIESAVKR